MKNLQVKNRDLDALVGGDILSFAKLPRLNPQNLDFPVYTLSLIEHDYEAKTPVMWNKVYHKFGIEAGNVMLVGNIGNLPEILEALRRDPKYIGGGAGVGFKDEIISQLDELDSLAEQIGATNFVMKTPEGKLKGYNTDGLGYVRSLEEKFIEQGQELNGKKAVMLGSGGTGNAIAFMLVDKGANLVILNRDADKAKRLADKINVHFKETRQVVRAGGEDLIADEVINADAIVNVSTKGAAGRFEEYYPLAVARLDNLSINIAESRELLRIIPKSTILSDVVLRDGGTPFLRAAKEKGFQTLDGIPMVVYQGLEAIWLLHGLELEKKGVTKKQVADVMKQAAHY